MTALKLACAALTIGTNDVPGFYNFMVALRTMNVCELYHHTILFNNPPLVASYLTILDTFVGDSIREFGFFIRLPGILADLVMALFMISQRRREPLASCPTWALALFIASPVSFLVSGFHGNFDSLVVCLIFLAAWMCVREQPVLSALFLALSLQIKVPAVILLPVFFIYWYRHGALKSFTLCLIGVCAVGASEPLLHDPVVFIHNVFGYSSYWGSWGISYWLLHTFWPPLVEMRLNAPTFMERLITMGLKVLIIGGISWLAWTRRPFTKEQVFPVLAVSWSLFFCLTPGGCVQYMVWLAPFVLLYHARWYLGLTVCCSIFCYMFYQIVNGSWLLYYANSTARLYWRWSPWMLWAWVSASYGLYLFWREKTEQRQARNLKLPSGAGI